MSKQKKADTKRRSQKPVAKRRQISPEAAEQSMKVKEPRTDRKRRNLLIGRRVAGR